MADIHTARGYAQRVGTHNVWVHTARETRIVREYTQLAMTDRGDTSVDIHMSKSRPESMPIYIFLGNPVVPGRHVESRYVVSLCDHGTEGGLRLLAVRRVPGDYADVPPLKWATPRYF